jgi:hypothetical protein
MLKLVEVRSTPCDGVPPELSVCSSSVKFVLVWASAVPHSTSAAREILSLMFLLRMFKGNPEREPTYRDGSRNAEVVGSRSPRLLKLAGSNTSVAVTDRNS